MVTFSTGSGTIDVGNLHARMPRKPLIVHKHGKDRRGRYVTFTGIAVRAYAKAHRGWEPLKIRENDLSRDIHAPGFTNLLARRIRDTIRPVALWWRQNNPKDKRILDHLDYEDMP